MGLRQIRLEGQGLLETADGVVQPAEAFEGQAQIETEYGIGWIQLDGLPDQGRGMVNAALAEDEHPQQVQGIGMPGIGLEDLTIKLFGLKDIAGLMMVDCQAE